MALPAFEPPPEGDPLWKVWLPETPWRPMPPAIPQVSYWECKLCKARGCPVPWAGDTDGGVEHVRAEHGDVLAAAVAAANQIAAEEAAAQIEETQMEPQGEPQEPDEMDAALRKLVDTEQMTRSIRALSRDLNPAVQALVEEGWTEVQARELVLALFLKGLGR